MTSASDTKLFAHQSLYAAVNRIDEAPRIASPLASLDRLLAENHWRWEPSPTAFQNWAEFAAAYRMWRERQIASGIAE